MFHRDIGSIAMKIFNPTSLFLNLNCKKNHQMTLTGLFIENSGKNNLRFTETL